MEQRKSFKIIVIRAYYTIHFTNKQKKLARNRRNLICTKHTTYNMISNSKTFKIRQWRDLAFQIWKMYITWGGRAYYYKIYKFEISLISNTLPTMNNSPTLAQLEALLRYVTVLMHAAAFFAREENRITVTKKDVKKAVDHHARTFGPAWYLYFANKQKFLTRNRRNLHRIMWEFYAFYDTFFSRYADGSSGWHIFLFLDR